MSSSKFGPSLVTLWCVLLVLVGCAAPDRGESPLPGAALSPSSYALDPCIGAYSEPPHAGSPESVALQNFQTWSQFPARSIRAKVLLNDGSFARVEICAEMRHGPTDVWEEFSGEYGLAFTSGRWLVRESPLGSGNRFLPVAVAATAQAAEQAELSRIFAALAAKRAIHAQVLSLNRVKDDEFNQSYWTGMLEFQADDGLQHTIDVTPHFTATLARCDGAAAQFEGVPANVSVSVLYGTKPTRLVGPDSVQHEYHFDASPSTVAPFVNVTHCDALVDARSLELVYERIDGVTETQLELAQARQPRLTAVASFTPTVVVDVANPARVASTRNVSARPSESRRVMDLSPIWFVGIMIVALGTGVWLVRNRSTSQSLVATPTQTMAPSVDAPSTPVEPPSGMRASPAIAGAPAESQAPVVATCFGGAQVVADGRVLWPAGEFANEQRAWELLLFLAASPPEGADRDIVGAALWREVDLADVAGSLRQLRRRLRGMLVRAVPGLPESAPFEPDTGRVYRLDTKVITSDVHHFMQLTRLARTHPGERLEILERAFALYAGDLFDSPISPPFALAVDRGDDGTSLRQQYRAAFLAICRTLGDLHATGKPGTYTERAVDLYRRLLQEDPLDERTWRALLSVHANRNDGPALDREWRRVLEAIRAADPTASPERATADLYSRLRADL